VGVLAALALGSGCTKEAAGHQAISVVGEGVINDPTNRTLRFELLQFGLSQMCSEMTSRFAALQRQPAQPSLGRFAARTCEVLQQDPNQQALWVNFSGEGFAWMRPTGRIGFASQATVGYSPDFRLHEVMREDLGGTYGVGVSYNSQIQPDSEYSVRVSFGTDPARLEELTQVVFAEIRAFQEEGPADSIVQKVRESQRRSRETSLRENRYWLSQIWGSLIYTDSDWADFYRYEELIDGLTKEIIRAAAQSWLHADNYVQVTLYPERATP